MLGSSKTQLLNLDRSPSSLSKNRPLLSDNPPGLLPPRSPTPHLAGSPASSLRRASSSSKSQSLPASASNISSSSTSSASLLPPPSSSSRAPSPSAYLASAIPPSDISHLWDVRGHDGNMIPSSFEGNDEFLLGQLSRPSRSSAAAASSASSPSKASRRKSSSKNLRSNSNGSGSISVSGPIFAPTPSPSSLQKQMVQTISKDGLLHAISHGISPSAPSSPSNYHNSNQQQSMASDQNDLLQSLKKRVGNPKQQHPPPTPSNNSSLSASYSSSSSSSSFLPPVNSASPRNMSSVSPPPSSSPSPFDPHIQEISISNSNSNDDGAGAFLTGISGEAEDASSSINSTPISSTPSVLYESRIPQEFHVSLAAPLRQKFESYSDVKFSDEKRLWEKQVFPSPVPSGRVEVLFLAQTLDKMMQKMQQQQNPPHMELQSILNMSEHKPATTAYFTSFSFSSTFGTELEVWDVVFAEVVRQVHVHCVERGLLLEKIRIRFLELFRGCDGILSKMRNAFQKSIEKLLQEASDREAALLSQLLVERARSESLEAENNNLNRAVKRFAQNEINGKSQASGSVTLHDGSSVRLLDINPENFGEVLKALGITSDEGGLQFLSPADVEALLGKLRTTELRLAKVEEIFFDENKMKDIAAQNAPFEKSKNVFGRVDHINDRLGALIADHEKGDSKIDVALKNLQKQQDEWEAYKRALEEKMKEIMVGLEQDKNDIEEMLAQTKDAYFRAKSGDFSLAESMLANGDGSGADGKGGKAKKSGSVFFDGAAGGGAGASGKDKDGSFVPPSLQPSETRRILGADGKFHYIREDCTQTDVSALDGSDGSGDGSGENGNGKVGKNGKGGKGGKNGGKGGKNGRGSTGGADGDGDNDGDNDGNGNGSGSGGSGGKGGKGGRGGKGREEMTEDEAAVAIQGAFRRSKLGPSFKPRNQRLQRILARYGKTKPKAYVWMLRHLYSYYHEKLEADRISDSNSTDRSTCPEFVFDYFAKTFGVGEVMEEYTGSLVSTLQLYRKSNVDAEVFTLFLSEEWDKEVLGVFLSALKDIETSRIGVSYPSPNFTSVRDALGSVYVCCTRAEWIAKRLFPTQPEAATEVINFIKSKAEKASKDDVKEHTLSPGETALKMVRVDFLHKLCEVWTNANQRIPSSGDNDDDDSSTGADSRPMSRENSSAPSSSDSLVKSASAKLASKPK